MPGKLIGVVLVPAAIIAVCTIMTTTRIYRLITGLEAQTTRPLSSIPDPGAPVKTELFVKNRGVKSIRIIINQKNVQRLIIS